MAGNLLAGSSLPSNLVDVICNELVAAVRLPFHVELLPTNRRDLLDS